MKILKKLILITFSFLFSISILSCGTPSKAPETVSDEFINKLFTGDFSNEDFLNSLKGYCHKDSSAATDLDSIVTQWNDSIKSVEDEGIAVDELRALVITCLKNTKVTQTSVDTSDKNLPKITYDIARKEPDSAFFEKISKELLSTVLKDLNPLEMSNEELEKKVETAFKDYLKDPQKIVDSFQAKNYQFTVTMKKEGNNWK
ncbi:MAG: hypothetical protein ACRDD2_01085, partial [Sarcina sp.]